MSANTQQLPSTFASLDEARDNLSWVEARLKDPSTNWADHGDIFRDYIDVLAKSYSEGNIDADEAEECYTTLPRKNYAFNLTHYEEWFEDAVNKHGHPKSGSGTLGWTDGKPLNLWIQDNLVKLTVTKYSDSNMKANYKWLFDTGEERQVVETQLHHNDASQFETKIDETFVFVEIDAPDEELRKGGNWKRKFVRPLIRKSGKVTVEEPSGPRTICIEAIKDMLEVRTAYYDIDRADDADGVFIDPVEPDWMYVRSSLIAHEATEHGFENTEPIRTELEFQGVVNGKVSVQKRLSDGRNPRWWKLPRGFANVTTEDDEDTPAGGERFKVDDESGDSE